MVWAYILELGNRSQQGCEQRAPAQAYLNVANENPENVGVLSLNNINSHGGMQKRPVEACCAWQSKEMCMGPRAARPRKPLDTARD